jgi:hypothetical protein
MTAPSKTAKAPAHDYVVKDVSLAEWGRKETPSPRPRCPA